ncbi:plastocyanin/azurin family copper-binding protein [Salinibacter ruber]|uniref:plastocyanin/azurin family copper-binding protein n=1 Tax=Salinibacter ruber TaxID=146919 RepID=UPI0020730BB9|nr:plastocyanin/azurin family copper-binding protein [Salinibacter ruber]MCS4197825.1 azurin [Salinibacter ruber]
MANEQDVSRRDFLQRLSVVGIAGLGAGSLVSACGGGGGEGGGSSSGSTSQSASQASGQSGGGGAQTVTIHPQGNQMKYKETEFEVPADTEIELVFENTASSPSMQHNVLVMNKPPEQGTFKEVGQAGVQAGASNEYVPDHPAVLAATDISKPGETVSVTFTTPSESGKYGYVCTYPGHWATMQGTMIVT